MEERLRRVSTLYAGIRCRAKEEAEGYESEDEWDMMEYGGQEESDGEELESSDGEAIIVIDDDEEGERKMGEAGVGSGFEKMEAVKECVEEKDGSLRDEDAVTVRDGENVFEKNREVSQTCRPAQIVKQRVLYSPLAVEQEAFLNEPLRFPVIVTGASGETVCLYSEDITSLQDSKGYTTDSIMDAFCCLLNKRTSTTPESKRVFMFSSLFLASVSKRTRRTGKRRTSYEVFMYERVKKMYSLDFLSDTDLFLFPLFLENHFNLIIADRLRKIFVIYEPLGKATQVAVRKLQHVKKWFNLRFAEDCDVPPFSKDEYGCNAWEVIRNTDFPRQQDTSSCGLFCLFLAESIARGAEPAFEQGDVINLRRRAEYWFRKNKLEMPDS